MLLARVGARTDSTMHYSYNARRGQFPCTRIGIVHKTRRRICSMRRGFALQCFSFFFHHFPFVRFFQIFPTYIYFLPFISSEQLQFYTFIFHRLCKGHLLPSYVRQLALVEIVMYISLCQCVCLLLCRLKPLEVLTPLFLFLLSSCESMSC